MVVVVGREGRMVSSILGLLAERGVQAHGGIPQDEESDLFGLVAGLEATALVGVEPLAWWGEGAPGGGDADLMERCLRACRAPSQPRLVWVTSGGSDTGVIRRSGIPYVLVRTAPLVPVPPDLAGGALLDREVLVPEDLPPPLDGAATSDAVAEAVVSAVETEHLGRTVEAGYRGEPAWRDLVESLGARARPVGPWRARAARLLGQPVLAVDARGITVRGTRAPARPDGVPAPSRPAGARSLPAPGPGARDFDDMDF